MNTAYHMHAIAAGAGGERPRSDNKEAEGGAAGSDALERRGDGRHQDQGGRGHRQGKGGPREEGKFCAGWDSARFRLQQDATTGTAEHRSGRAAGAA